MVVEHDEGRESPEELGGPVGTSDGHRLEVYGRMGDHLWTMMEQVAGTGMVVDPDVGRCLLLWTLGYKKVLEEVGPLALLYLHDAHDVEPG